MKRSLEMAALLVGLVTGTAGLLHTAVVVPYRVGSLEKRMDTAESNYATNRELLVRIDERVNQILQTQKENYASR